MPTALPMLPQSLTKSREQSGEQEKNNPDGKMINCRVSTVEAMQFLAATAGPFLSKALKNGLGSVYVFAGIIEYDT